MSEVPVKEWVGELKEELERRTGRKDIEVSATNYCNYDALVSAGADKHPIVTFYSDIRGDPSRLTPALDYVVALLQNWEATTVLHEKGKQDCLPFYERLQREFPQLVLTYNVLDFDQHFVKVEKVADKIVASFDLWPKMTEEDIRRLTFYIGDFEATLHRENAEVAGVTYWWKCAQ